MSGDPPVPRRGTFPLPSRRGGACPSRRFLERPRPAHPRSRTLCHGWSEPGAAVKWHRPKFCTAPGPSGPEGMKSGTVFCALELLRKGVGVSPVNGGPGEERLWAGTPIGARLRRRFASFADAAKEVAPQGETCEAWRAESSRPTSVMVREGRAGQETRPYGVDGEIFRGGEPAGGFQNYFL